MATNPPVRIVCPHCGFMEVYFNPSEFPICECCGYEDPIIINHEDFLKFNNEITAKDPDASVYEACREKYVYPSEHFSKKAYNDMLKYAEEKKRRTQEEYDRICHTPKCPTCGSTDLRKGPWVQRLCLWAYSVSLARK